MSARMLLLCAAIGTFVGAVIIVAAFMGTVLLFPIADRLPPRDGAALAVVSVLLNVVVPAIAGALVAIVAGPTQRREFPRLARMPRHFAWCASWYLGSAACLVLLIWGWREPDFWLVGQIFLWPAAALAAAIATDAIAGRRARGTIVDGTP